MMVPQIPPELSDRIIDHIYNDVCSLSACALTCRTWLPASRYHRFNRTDLNWKMLESFHTLLDECLEIGSFVSILALDNLYLASRRFDPSTLSTVLAKLPSLKHLILANHVLTIDELSVLVASLGSRPLTSLSLFHCRFYDSEDLVKLVSSLHSLKKLDLERISAILPSGGTPLTLLETYPRPALKELRFKTHSLTSEQFCEWLLSTEDKPTIQKFSSYMEEEIDAAATCVVLEQTGKSITDLHLVLDSDSSLESLFRDIPLTLEHCPNLRKCHLEFFLREMCVPENRSLAWVCTLLSQICSSSLASIKVAIHDDRMEDLRALDSECGVRELCNVRFDQLQALDWASIHDIVTSDRFGSHMKLQFLGTGDPSGMEAFLEADYPVLRELVVFVHS